MEKATWILIISAIVSITGIIKTLIVISQNKRAAASSANTGSRAVTPIGNAPRSDTETGPMVYFANDRHGRKDREYRFNYKKVNGSWRAYILRTPSMGSRDTGCSVTHRLLDGDRPYVCWDTPIYNLKDMQAVSRVWADSIQEYIATGKRFG